MTIDELLEAAKRTQGQIKFYKENKCYCSKNRNVQLYLTNYGEIHLYCDRCVADDDLIKRKLTVQETFTLSILC